MTTDHEAIQELLAGYVLRSLSGEDAAAGRFQVGRGLLNAHTGTGAVAVVLWTVFLVAPESTALGGAVGGIIALAFWWTLVALGFLVLARWMPAGGKRAAGPVVDTWPGGPGLSVLAHVGMLLAVVVFTWDYLFSVV